MCWLVGLSEIWKRSNQRFYSIFYGITVIFNDAAEVRMVAWWSGVGSQGCSAYLFCFMRPWCGGGYCRRFVEAQRIDLWTHGPIDDSGNRETGRIIKAE